MHEENDIPVRFYRDDTIGKLLPLKGQAMSFIFGEEEEEQLPKGGNLQDSFKKFRKQKVNVAKERAALAADKGEERKYPERMQALREKFIAQCKSYYGVPYAQRYHEPDSPRYHAPLFLDCCGLVRRVLRDLKEDFGFTPGPWNQAYPLTQIAEFDTLPIRYESYKDMKPGDLIFAEGKYYKEGRKPQKGDIVHVEVHLGEGPEGKSCLGSRWGKGVVGEFDSHEFEAKNWKLTRFHYCSLDTWLEGVCKSFHPERKWLRNEFTPGKYSIFNPDAEVEQDQDEVAGDDED